MPFILLSTAALAGMRASFLPSAVLPLLLHLLLARRYFAARPVLRLSSTPSCCTCYLLPASCRLAQAFRLLLSLLRLLRALSTLPAQLGVRRLLWRELGQQVLYCLHG